MTEIVLTSLESNCFAGMFKSVAEPLDKLLKNSLKFQDVSKVKEFLLSCSHEYLGRLFFGCDLRLLHLWNSSDLEDYQMQFSRFKFYHINIYLHSHIIIPSTRLLAAISICLRIIDYSWTLLKLTLILSVRQDILSQWKYLLMFPCQLVLIWTPRVPHLNRERMIYHFE
jgi:hypothetical protein